MTDAYRLPERMLTERFELRRITPDDEDAIFHGYATDAEVTRFLTWTTADTPDSTRAFLADANAQWDRGTGFPLAIVPRDRDSGLIGMIDPRVRAGTVNYGYVLRRDWWGKGCMSEVLRVLIDHAFAHPRIYRAEATCDADNPASGRVMENAGMTFEGVLRRWQVYPNISDTPRDSRMYARVR